MHRVLCSIFLRRIESGPSLRRSHGARLAPESPGPPFLGLGVVSGPWPPDASAANLLWDSEAAGGGPDGLVLEGLLLKGSSLKEFGGFFFGVDIRQVSSLYDVIVYSRDRAHEAPLGSETGTIRV